jgi:hypothetical protein
MFKPCYLCVGPVTRSHYRSSPDFRPGSEVAGDG